MKIEGTIFEFVKNGDCLRTNLLYPDLPIAEYNIPDISESEYQLVDDVSTVLFSRTVKESDKPVKAMRAFARRVYFNYNNSLHTFGYGLSWNFRSVIYDDDVLESVVKYIHSADNNQAFNDFVDDAEEKSFDITSNNSNKDSKKAEKENAGPNEEAIMGAINNAINFFSEFDFEPNFRFLNTLSRVGSGDISAAKEYIKEYFELIDSPYLNDVCEKMKSEEFKRIINVICSPSNTTKKKINTRFELYYGSQGTGKTTEAAKRSNGRCVVCNNSLLPNDLMEDFGFDDGKANFHPSALCKAMENGEVIVLDEFNLLPFESIRFLQGIIDGKETFIFKGHEIKIKDGFKIIGTMNLNVNGMTYALPAPIVDRCEVIKKYKLTAKELIGSII